MSLLRPSAHKLGERAPPRSLLSKRHKPTRARPSMPKGALYNSYTLLCVRVCVCVCVCVCVRACVRARARASVQTELFQPQVCEINLRTAETLAPLFGCCYCAGERVVYREGCSLTAAGSASSHLLKASQCFTAPYSTIALI